MATHSMHGGHDLHKDDAIARRMDATTQNARAAEAKTQQRLQQAEQQVAQEKQAAEAAIKLEEERAAKQEAADKLLKDRLKQAQAAEERAEAEVEAKAKRDDAAKREADQRALRAEEMQQAAKEAETLHISKAQGNTHDDARMEHEEVCDLVPHVSAIITAMDEGFSNDHVLSQLGLDPTSCRKDIQELRSEVCGQFGDKCDSAPFCLFCCA